MFKRLSFIALAAVVASLVVGGISFATANTKHTITVIAKHVVFTTADVGDTGASPGDELVFTARDVSLAGERVGRLDGYCVFTLTPNGQDQYEECMLTHTLENGQITLQGQFKQGASGNQAFAVTGGTGAYDNATGEAILRFQSEFRFDIVLES